MKKVDEHYTFDYDKTCHYTLVTGTSNSMTTEVDKEASPFLRNSLSLNVRDPSLTLTLA